MPAAGALGAVVAPAPVSVARVVGNVLAVPLAMDGSYSGLCSAIAPALRFPFVP
jgi:hypothetical protein